jgi:hypothetical protein
MNVAREIARNASTEVAWQAAIAFGFMEGGRLLCADCVEKLGVEADRDR